MAQIWMDEENAGAHMLPRSARKLMGNTLLQQSGKKSVLSKLDNVLHRNYNNNKPGLTPKSVMGVAQRWPMSCAPKLSLCKETLQKQHQKKLTKDTPHLVEGQPKGGIHSSPATGQDLYARSADVNDKFDLFDFMDFPNERCLKNCQKPVSTTWSEPLFTDDLIYKIVHNVHPDNEEKNPHEIPIHSDSEDEGYEELTPPEHKEAEVDVEYHDISVELPASIDFDDFDFF